MPSRRGKAFLRRNQCNIRRLRGGVAMGLVGQRKYRQRQLGQRGI